MCGYRLGLTLLPVLALLAWPLPTAIGQATPGGKPAEPGEKSKKAVETLKGKLDSFYLSLSVFGGRSKSTGILLVTDAKAPRTEGVHFVITKDQATTIIDHLAKAGRSSARTSRFPAFRPPAGT
jgi:hypothetical protein